jgi:hypothetical protein
MARSLASRKRRTGRRGRWRRRGVGKHGVWVQSQQVVASVPHKVYRVIHFAAYDADAVTTSKHLFYLLQQRSWCAHQGEEGSVRGAGFNRS